MTTEPGKLVRMRVTAGFPFWEGSTWEWQLGPATRAEAGTGVLFRHYGFGEGYAGDRPGPHRADLGADPRTGWPRSPTAAPRGPFFPEAAA